MEVVAAHLGVAIKDISLIPLDPDRYQGVADGEYIAMLRNGGMPSLNVSIHWFQHGQTPMACYQKNDVLELV